MKQNKKENKDINGQSGQAEKEQYGFAAASLTVGIIAVTVCITFGLILGPIGIALGLISIARNEDKRALAKGGIVTSAVSFAVGIALLVIILLGYLDLKEQGIDIYNTEIVQEIETETQLQ
jgi:F0F1-type ATP synthase membrane subunit a